MLRRWAIQRIIGFHVCAISTLTACDVSWTVLACSSIKNTFKCFCPESPTCGWGVAPEGRGWCIQVVESTRWRCGACARRVGCPDSSCSINPNGKTKDPNTKQANLTGTDAPRVSHGRYRTASIPDHRDNSEFSVSKFIIILLVSFACLVLIGLKCYFRCPSSRMLRRVHPEPKSTPIGAPEQASTAYEKNVTQSSRKYSYPVGTDMNPGQVGDADVGNLDRKSHVTQTDRRSSRRSKTDFSEATGRENCVKHGSPQNSVPLGLDAQRRQAEADIGRLAFELEVIRASAVGGNADVQDMAARLIMMLSSSHGSDHRKLLKDLMVEYHPDKNHEPHAQTIFQYINNVRSRIEASDLP